MADHDGRSPWPRQERGPGPPVGPGGRRARRAADPAGTDPSPTPRPSAPAPGSRRARRLAETAAAAEATRAPAGAAEATAGAHGTAAGIRGTGAAGTRGVPDPAGRTVLSPAGAAGPPGPPGLLGGPRPEPEPPAATGGPLPPLLATALLAWSMTGLPVPGTPQPVIGLLAVAASISPLVTVGAVLVGTLALRGRRWITSGLAIAAGLLPWLFVLPYTVPASTTNQPVTPVRVLVVNAQEGRADPGDISALVREQPTDLLVITELTGRMAHDLTTGGLGGELVARWVSVPPPTVTGTAAQSGLGVWSRLPMSGFAEVPGTHWPATRATLETGHGSLTVVAGHAVPPTPASGGTWSADLAALHDAAQVPGPVTVLGGLNGTPWNAQFRAAAGNGLHDAAEALGRGVRPTWPSWLGIPLLPLDNALVGGEVGVQSMTVMAIGGTDHRALMVILLVPGGPG